MFCYNIVQSRYGHPLNNTFCCIRSVSSIFFRALAVMDSILLITMLSRYWGLAQFGYDIGDANMFMCRFHPYMLYWSRDLSGWILAVIALERYMGVSRPHWNKIVFTRKRAIGILFGLIFVFALLNISLPISHDMQKIEYEYYYYSSDDDTNLTDPIPNISENISTNTSYDPIFSSGEEHNENGYGNGYRNEYENQDGYIYVTADEEQTETRFCCMTTSYDNFNQHIWPYIDLIKQSMVPFIIILTCNVTIIYTVIKAKHVRSRDMNSQSNNNNLRGMTALLISVSFVYLICTFPAAILYIFKQKVLSNYSSDSPMPADIQAQWQLYKAIAILLISTNSAVNFPLYCMSGPKFRTGLLNLFITEREMRRKSARSFSRSTISTHACTNNFIRQMSTTNDGKSLMRQISSNSIIGGKLLLKQTPTTPL